MEIINLTTHSLSLYNEAGELVLEVPPSGTVARVKTLAVKAGETPEGVPLYQTEFGGIEGLPAPQPDTIYAVSALVRGHPDVQARLDVYSPGRLLRDEDGRPIGAVGLTR